MHFAWMQCTEHAFTIISSVLWECALSKIQVSQKYIRKSYEHFKHLLWLLFSYYFQYTELHWQCNKWWRFKLILHYHHTTLNSLMQGTNCNGYDLMKKQKKQSKPRAKQCHGRVCFRLSCSADNRQLANIQLCCKGCPICSMSFTCLISWHPLTMLLAVCTHVTISNSIHHHAPGIRAVGLLLLRTWNSMFHDNNQCQWLCFPLVS